MYWWRFVVEEIESDHVEASIRRIQVMARVIDRDGNFGVDEEIFVSDIPDSTIEFNRLDAEPQPLELF